RTLAQALDVQNHDGACFQAQPATLHELGQGLVHGLTRSANQLGQLFLGQLVGDQDAVGGRAAETVSQVQQGLGNTTRNVREDQVRQRLVGAAQAGSQGLEQLDGNLGGVQDRLAQVLVAQTSQAGLGDCGGGGVARVGVE